ncbi:MAG: DUF928 domain-containing protein [Moorea sp. SIO2B7]|nr:DUF928 domain-containing protein [Moorena sp. SIO2B7]
MGLSKSIKYFAILAGIISPTLGAFALVPPQITGESYREGLVSVDFPKASPSRGRALSSAGGGTRGGGECTKDTLTGKRKVPLVAMLTDKGRQTEASNVLLYGKTESSAPTMYVYIPANSAQSAEFVVKTAEDEYIINQEFDLPEQNTGWIRLSLPNQSLEKNKSYEWELALICDIKDRNQDTYISGTIERTILSREQKNKLEPLKQEQQQNALAIERLERQQSQNSLDWREIALLERLKQKQEANLIKQADLYAEFQFVNESLAALAKLHDSNQNSWKYEWRELLNSIGITEKQITNADFVANVELEN